MQRGNGKVVLGLRGYSAWVTQDTHHLEGTGERTMKREDQSIEKVEEKHFFSCKCSAIVALHGEDASRNKPLQL